MKILTNSTIRGFIDHLKQKRLSPSESVSQIDIVLTFTEWLSKTKRVPEGDILRYKNELYKAKREFTPHKAPLTSFPLKYVGFSLAVLSLLLVGGGIYLRFYKNVKTPFAYSSAPVRAGRIISFQGRLTDTLGNPITAPIDITYNFYTVPTGGSPIASSTRVCTASPDQDGIFNALIGNDSGGTGGTACNQEIPTDVFTNNTNVYLGVTIGTEITEMSPRQQIANVGYAINSETLQGMPPGQGVSNIPYINQDGNMLIAASSPGIRSISSSNFTISSAQATTIQSAGSGDITLSATEGGSLRFNTYNGTLEERMTILNTGRVGIGTVAPRALLDVNGDATVSGSLIAGGQIKIGDFNAAPSNVGKGSLYYDNTTNKVYFWNGSAWTEVGAGSTSQYWQRTLGSLAPANITDDLNLGAVASASATVHLPGLIDKDAWFSLGTGNVGIGTAAPGAKLEVAGQVKITGGTPGLNKILSSDATGLASWNTLVGLGGVGGSGTLNYIPKFTPDGNTLGNSTIFDNGSIGIGTALPSALLDVNGTLKVASYATISASLALGTSNAAAGPGNLDMSGDFTIGGAIKPGGNAGLNGYLLTSSAGGVNTWTDPATISGINYWGIGSGSLYPVNATLDMFIGGQASASAKFAFLNVNSGTPTASVSAGITGGTFLTANGTLSTTNRQTLILGNSASYDTTGDVLINPNGTGNVGIGTTAPSTSLHVAGGSLKGITVGANYPSWLGDSGVFVQGSIYSVGGYLASDSYRYGQSTVEMYGNSVGSTADYWYLSTNSTERLRVDGFGNVGIGIANPAAKLDILGNLNVSTYATISASLALGTSNAAAGPGNLDMSGNLTTGGTITFSSLPTGIVHSTLGVLSSSALDLASEVTGVLTSANGGTGADNSSATQYSVPYYSTTGVLGGVLTPGLAGYVLSTNGAGGAPSWIPAGGVGTNYWEIANGALYPSNSTLDTFIGGTASTSAKFAFLNVDSGVPTASIAGSLANSNTYITGDGMFATTNMAPLTLGATTTGPMTLGSNTQTIYINSNDWDIGTSGNMSGIGTIASNGDWTNSQTTPSIFLTDSSTSADDYSINVDGNAYNITNATDSRVEMQFIGDGSIDLGDNTATKTIDIGGNTNSSTDTINISSNGTLADVITIGNNNAATTLALTGGTAWSIGTTGNLALAGTTTLGGLTYTWPGTQAANYILKTDGAGTLSWIDPVSAVGSAIPWIEGAGVLYPKNATLDVFIGGQASASAKFAFLNVNSGTPTASVSAGATGGTFLTANGSLSTTNRQTLTLGNSASYNTTGDILLNPNGTGNVGIGVTSPLAKLQVGGGNIFVDSTYGIDTATAGTLALGDTTANVINIGTNATARTISMGNATGATSLALNSGTGDISLTSTDQILLFSSKTAGAATAEALSIRSTVDLGATDEVLQIGDSAADFITVLGNGRVGIGATSPGNLLQLGTAGTTAGTLSLAGGSSGLVTLQTAATAGTWTFTLPTTGGTTNFVLSTNGSGTTNWTDVNTLVTGMAQFWQRTLGSLAPTNITDAFNLGSIATSSALVHFPGTNNADGWINLGTGNIGIGNAAPTAGYKLDVSGKVLATDFYDKDNPTYFVNPGGSSILGLNLTVGGNVTMANASASGTLTVGQDQSIQAALGDLYFKYNVAGTMTNGMVLTDTGRIGIGTINPDYALDVVGNIKLSSGLIAGTNGAGVSGYVLTSAGGGVNTWTDLMTPIVANNLWQRTSGSMAPKNITDALNLGAIASNSAMVHLPGTNNQNAWFNLGTGYVGIGTITPDALLTVKGSSNQLRLYGTATSPANQSATFNFNSSGDNSLDIRTDYSGGTGNVITFSPGGTERVRFQQNGNVGIGTTPTAKLDILGNLNVSTYATVGASLAVGYPSALAGPGHGIFAGLVGIGTSSITANAKLDVRGRILATELYDFDDSNYYINPAGAGNSLNVAGGIKMGGDINMIGAAPTITSNNGGTYSTITLKGSNDTTSVSVCIEGTGTCNGKLDVGTVDPPYTINGKKYATYMPSMTGVKEETTGQIALNSKSQTVNAYEYAIDFDSLEEGSDLWLFAKTTNLKQKISAMSVLLSPNENARTWYKIDEARHKLTLYSSRPTTLSYRLTAPRFDAENWKNSNPNGSGGFTIDDPDTLSQEDISIDGNGNLTGQLVVSSGNDSGFQVLDEMGTVVEETVLQAKTISAHIVAGLINAQKIVSPLAEIETLRVSNKVTSPVVETDEIKPVNKNLVFTLNTTDDETNKGNLSKVIIKGLHDNPVAQFDAVGNATFAGTLTAENASISGTLIAKNIQSDTIDNLTSQIASSSTTIATNYEQLSTNINAVQQELASIKSLPLPDPKYYQNIDASYGNLTVNDTANIYKAHIADSLVVGTLFIQPSSILALSNDLYISSLDKIHLFDDAVIIAKNGDMAIKGEVSATSLAIKNTDGKVVASIDASGSAKFNEVIAKKFTLENIATQGALIADSGLRNEENLPIPGIKTSTEVAGTGVVPQDVKEVVVYNKNVTENSLIYLTSTTNNIQGQLSVTKKVSCQPADATCTPYFIISSSTPIHSPSSFNWLILN